MTVASPRRAAELCAEGIVAYTDGAFLLAAERFAAAIALDPTCVPAWSNLGSALLSLGDPEAAAGAHARAIALDPTNAEVHYNLGSALRRAGDPARAAFAYIEAASLGLETAELFNNLGLALADDGRLDDAIASYGRALALAPDAPSTLVNLGNALAEAARPDEAARCHERVLARDPAEVEAAFNLFALVYDDRDPASAERLLRGVLDHAPDHPGARFHLGALVALRDGRAAAEPILARLPPGHEHLRASLDHALTHRSAGTRLFTDGFRVLDHALAAATLDGLVIELGVRRGTSVNYLADRCAGLVHGFDSFEGLPEAWRGVAAGAYSTRGELPAVRDNVALHAGWFTDTLPAFLAAHPGPIRFLNVDCDLYASTRDALALLGPRLVPGSVVVFDEYLANPGWEDDEHRAWVEAAEAFGLRYEHLAWSLFSKQAALLVR